MSTPTRPECSICQAPDPIRGEGEDRLVCRRCVAALGRIAAVPFAFPETVRNRLLMRSLDVVALFDGSWTWTNQWPGRGDTRLVRGGQA